MINISRLLELKRDLALLHAMENEPAVATIAGVHATTALIDKIGPYRDILEDWLAIQQRSA